jgi:hypothetical protein
MALNLNVDPYFDDFDANKNYSRILFKPGVAVQARELTQLQTALQNQISSLGSFTLKEGAIISGCAETLTKVAYVKVLDTDATTPTALSISNTTLSNYVGLQVQGGTTGIKATIVEVATGDVSSRPNLKTLYVQYTDFGGSQSTHFAADEVLTVISHGDKKGKTFVVDNIQGTTFADVYHGHTIRLQLSPGIIYVHGQFVLTKTISTFLHRYAAVNDKRKVGFLTTETIVGASTDSTLEDPATGTYNFSAPGADRYQITVDLVAYSVSTATGNNFFRYADVQDGQIVRTKLVTDPLNKLGDLIATKHYNANGNYVINGLLVQVQEHSNDGVNRGLYTPVNGGDTNKLAVVIQKGLANVGGYDIEVRDDIVKVIDKPTATEELVGSTFTTSYGNYIIVDEFCGIWDVDTGSEVYLYDAAIGAVTNGLYSESDVALGSSVIGTAKVRHIKLESGNPGSATAQYRIYLYDIKMTSSSFSNVRGLTQPDSVYNARGMADVVSSELKETNFNKFIWRLPKNYVKTIENSTTENYDYSFFYQKEFISTITSGVATLTIPSSESAVFSQNNGPLTDTLIDDNIVLVTTQASASLGLEKGEAIDLSSSAYTVTKTGTKTIEIDFGDTNLNAIPLKAYAVIKGQAGTPHIKTYHTSHVKIETDVAGISGKYCLGFADVFKIVSVTAYTADDYTTGEKDVTSQFRLDNGQRDNYYGLSYAILKPNSSLDLSTYTHLVFELDHFNISEGDATFTTIDSYQVMIDEGSITLQEVPLYASSNNGVFDLRNCIDFRPYVTDTATLGASVATASVNPSEEESYNTIATNPSPTGVFTTSVTSYYAQGARVVIDNSGAFKVITGNANEKVEIPKADPGQMTLATFIIPPYPSLSMRAAKAYNRPEMGIAINQIDNPRYTMRDIGALEKRIKNLEYYTSLSLLEKEAKDKSILDSNGVNRFKNGLLIDSFRGHNVASVSNPDFKASINGPRQELLPYFSDDVMSFVPVELIDGSQAGQSGEVFHARYTEAVYQSNLEASKSTSVVIELLYDTVTEEEIEEREQDPTSKINPVIPDPIIPDPPPQPVPTFRVLRNFTHVDEGGTALFTLETAHAKTGATVGYTISGIDQSDLTSGSIGAGTFTISSGGTAEVSFGIANDNVSDGTDTIVLTLDATDSEGNATGSPSASIIINDTSQTEEETIVCISPYVLIDGACVPVCPSGTEWNPSTQTCHTICILPPGPGILSLSPSQDVWSSTEYIEPVYNNKTGSYDQFNYEDAWNVTDSWPGETDIEILSTSTKTWEDQTGYKETYAGTEYGEPSWGEAGYTYYDYAEIYDTTTTYTSYEQTVKNVIETSNTINQLTYAGVLPDDIIVFVKEDKVNENLRPYTRAQSILFTAENMIPNGAFMVTAGGKDKGIVYSDFQGRLSDEIHIEEGEFPCGEIPINLSVVQSSGDYSYLGSSTASASFYSGGKITVKQKIYDRVIAPYPEPKTEPALLTGTSAPYEVYGDVITTGTREEQGVRWDYMSTYGGVPTSGIAIAGTNSVVTNSGSLSKAGNLLSSNNANSSGRVTIASTDTGASSNANVTNTVSNSNKASNIKTIAGTTPSGTIDIQGDINLQLAAMYNGTGEDRMIAAQLAMINLCWDGRDPMAQTFLVSNMPGGMYVPSVELFFSSISSEGNNNGITLELREVINGYPGPTVIPGGRAVKRRSDCRVSTTNADNSVTLEGTLFKFDTPVYLENDTEYCIIPMPENNDPDYKVWIGELGKPVVGTTQVISKQAHSGVLFTSANNRTWTAHQKEDLCFKINRCSFVTNTDYNIKVNNADIDWLEFSNFTEGTKFIEGMDLHSFTLTETTQGVGYTSAPAVTITGGGGVGAQATATFDSATETVTGITITNPGQGYTSTPTITIGEPDNALTTDTPAGNGVQAVYSIRLNKGKVITNSQKYNTATVKVTDGYFNVGDLVGSRTSVYATVDTIHNRVVDKYVLRAKVENFGSKGVLSPKVAFTATGAANANTTLTNTVNGEIISLPEQKTIYSYSNEQTIYSGVKTATVQFTLSTPVDNVSPMINIDSALIGLFAHQINNDASGEEVAVGGSSLSRYISRRVILAEGQDAEDLIVYLDNAIPSNADVKVYCKLKNSSDDGDFLEDIIWKELSLIEQPFNTSQQAWGEYAYGIPAKANGFGLNAGVVEYDIGRVTSIAVTAPGSNYTAAPDVIISGGGGTGAKAYATYDNVSNTVTGITITNTGRNYTSTPTVTIVPKASDTTGTGSTATATVETTTYSGYKSYAIKIVPLSTDTARIPKSTNLRAYALQA